MGQELGEGELDEILLWREGRVVEVEELERMWVRECTEDSDGPFVFVRTFCYICYAILTKIKDII